MTIPWLRLSTRVAHFLGVTLPEETDFEVGVEAWGRGDYDRALREFRPLAEQGHTEAQFHLGIMYSQGLVMSQEGGFYGPNCNPIDKHNNRRCGLGDDSKIMGYSLAKG